MTDEVAARRRHEAIEFFDLRHDPHTHDTIPERTALRVPKSECT
jgi:hypothetical protein